MTDAMQVKEALDQAQAVVDFLDFFEFKDFQPIFNEYGEGRCIRFNAGHLRTMVALLSERAPSPAALDPVTMALDELDKVADVVGHVGFELCAKLADDINAQTAKIRALIGPPSGNASEAESIPCPYCFGRGRLATVEPVSSTDSAWQPIETAPMDGTTVFIAGRSSNGTWFAADAKWDGQFWCLFHPDRDQHDEPTFAPVELWMPIPDPSRVSQTDGAAK